MRLTTAISAIVMLATAVSGHTVDCWGKSLHPGFRHTKIALGAVEHGPDSIEAAANSCVDVYCAIHMSIRYCNDGDKSRTMPMQNIMDSVKAIAHDCRSEYDGKTVAGGVVDHPDHWAVIVQKEGDDRCPWAFDSDIPEADL